MTETLRMLQEMHKKIEIQMASETAKNKVINEETEKLRKIMTEEIKKDMLKLLDVYENLGIKKSIFKTDIEMNPLHLGLNSGEKFYIGFVFRTERDRDLDLSQFRVNRYGTGFYHIFSTNCKTWNRIEPRSCHEVYKCWSKIKEDIETKIIKAYFEEQNAKYEQLGKERNEAMEMLHKMKEILHV